MKHILIITLLVLSGCASDPRINQIIRHQGHIDKQIDYIVMEGIDQDSARCLIESNRALEEIERNNDLIIDRRDHPVKWWWKDRFREWGE